jgi:general secretion pathway protein A
VACFFGSKAFFYWADIRKDSLNLKFNIEMLNKRGVIQDVYLSHYNFHVKPFQIAADPKFIWLGEKHAEALATLKYGLHGNKGIILITGDVGTGKTVVINAFLKNLDDNVIAVKIPDPGLDPIDLYNILSNEFKLNRKFNSKGSFLSHITPYLHKNYRQNKSILLIIDEAQNISNELLEEIRLLSNIELAETKLINIFIVGQNELDHIIDQNRNRAFRQRISIRYHLNPLNDSETHEYINHRLRVAGSDKEIFSSKAINYIHFFSAGFPRLINAICDLALLTGYSADKLQIDQSIIKECAQELKLSGKSKETQIRR